MIRFSASRPINVLPLRLNSIMISTISQGPSPSNHETSQKRASPINLDANLRLSSDPTTPIELLTSLANVAAPGVSWNVAVNPNTPELVLHRLWMEQHPLAALENPILAYRTLSTGKRLCELLPSTVKLAIYAALRNKGGHEELESYLPETDRFMWLTYGHQYHREELRQLPETVFDSACSFLVADSSTRVRTVMLNRLPEKYLELFVEDPECCIRLELAKKISSYWSCSSQRDGDRMKRLVDKLSADPEEEVRKVVAGCGILTAVAHLRLAKDASATVRQTLASTGQGSTLPEQGWRLLMEDGAGTCLLIARNNGCHESVRLDLTTHPDSAVRMEAWSHLDFEKVVLTGKLEQKLESLFVDPTQVNERLAVASNRTLTDPVIQRLLQCEDEVTRKLATNIRMKEDDLAALLQSADVQTAVNAMEQASTDPLLDAGARHRFAAVRALVADKRGIHASRLRLQLATDPSWMVREHVLSCMMNRLQHYRGEKISEIIALLSRDPLAKIRARVVSDYRVPRKELMRLLKDPSVRVRLAMLKYRGSDPIGHLGLLDHKRSGIRVAAAKLLLSPSSDVSVVMADKIASDPCIQVRKVAADSTYTPDRVLQKLIKDGAREVQLAMLARRLPTTQRGLRGWIGKCKTNPLTFLAASSNPYRRALVAGIYRAGKRRLRKLAADPCWYVRAKTAANGQDLEPHVLAKLAEDPHPLVRQKALARIPGNPSTYNHLSKGGRP